MKLQTATAVSVFAMLLLGCAKSPEELGFRNQADMLAAQDMGFETFSAYRAQGKFSDDERAIEALRKGYVDSEQLDQEYYEAAQDSSLEIDDFAETVSRIEDQDLVTAVVLERVQADLQLIMQSLTNSLEDTELALSDQQYLGFDIDACLRVAKVLELDDSSRGLMEQTFSQYCGQRRVDEYNELKAAAIARKAEIELALDFAKSAANFYACEVASMRATAVRGLDSSNKASLTYMFQLFQHLKGTVIGEIKGAGEVAADAGIDKYNDLVGELQASILQRFDYDSSGRAALNYWSENCVQQAAGQCQSVNLLRSMDRKYDKRIYQFCQRIN